MDFVLLHLRSNHFPICLGALGALAAVVAAIVRKDAVWKYAQITVLAAALTTPFAYWTGVKSEAVIGGDDRIDQELQDRMYVHEESAEWALYAMLAAGGLAAVSLWKPTPATRWAFLAVAVAGTGLIGWTSKQGGEVLHSVPLRDLEVRERKKG